LSSSSSLSSSFATQRCVSQKRKKERFQKKKNFYTCRRKHQPQTQHYELERKTSIDIGDIN